MFVIYLSPPTNDIVAAPPNAKMGFIITPDSDTARTNRYSMDQLAPWAADNGCFCAGERFDEFRFLCWLMGLRRWIPTCLFAVAPDVLGDALATWRRSRDWLGAIRVLGYPAAFVAQDGWEALAVDWSSFDVLFIGGSTEFKLASRPLCIEARERGKWVHVGRVNSKRRYDHFADVADSCDGTFVIYGPRANIPKVTNWVDSIREPTLFDLN